MGNGVRLFGVGSFALVGALGCAQQEEEWQFSRADMEAFVFGTYAGNYILPEETPIAMQLQVRPRDAVTRDLACASREFNDSEQGGTPGLDVRCDSTSSLAISGTLLVNDGSPPVDLDGWYTVFGSDLEEGNVWLTYRTSAATRLSVAYQIDRWKFCDIRTGDAYIGSCTIDARIQ